MFSESRHLVRAGNSSVDENHSRTVLLNKVRRTGVASLLGLGLLEPKSGILLCMQIRW